MQASVLQHNQMRAGCNTTHYAASKNRCFPSMRAATTCGACTLIMASDAMQLPIQGAANITQACEHVAYFTRERPGKQTAKKATGVHRARAQQQQREALKHVVLQVTTHASATWPHAHCCCSIPQRLFPWCCLSGTLSYRCAAPFRGSKARQLVLQRRRNPHARAQGSSRKFRMTDRQHTHMQDGAQSTAWQA